jgi:hypothetical protein
MELIWWTCATPRSSDKPVSSRCGIFYITKHQKLKYSILGTDGHGFVFYPSFYIKRQDKTLKTSLITFFFTCPNHHNHHNHPVMDSSISLMGKNFRIYGQTSKVVALTGCSYCSSIKFIFLYFELWNLIGQYIDPLLFILKEKDVQVVTQES